MLDVAAANAGDAAAQSKLDALVAGSFGSYSCFSYLDSYPVLCTHVYIYISIYIYIIDLHTTTTSSLTYL